ncbi:M20/M25/M40 family metallo-hydrolase [Streptomyces sp. NPDC004609]|uniref:M20/M25/M40 family metallo-hydrolase n=1 Tax=Streptomyces sp. NPDC004609 TaxID=3364704 RepID=UPI00368CF250
MKASHRGAAAAFAAAALATPLLFSPGTASAAGQSPTGGKDATTATSLAERLVANSSAADAYKHLQRFQRISDTTGNRAAGSLGHDASGAYVFNELKKYGYNVRYENFDFIYTETKHERLKAVSPTARDIQTFAFTYTKSTPAGGITAELAAVPVDATTGCEASDFASRSYTGKIVLMKRGGCFNWVKQLKAAEAGAVAVLVYNDNHTLLKSTLVDQNNVKVPTAGLTGGDGERLTAELANGPVTVNLDLDHLIETRNTNNVIAETKGGDPDNSVTLGAHLDSVSLGAGINDNGSGSAGLLEVAQELAKAEQKPKHKIRFAWWSAEEGGLHGSYAYTRALTPAQRQQHKLYLNFDMIASPNYVNFVLDGDNSDGVGAGPGPEGSGRLERDIREFLDRRGTPHDSSDFNARTDYAGFAEAGIASGGTSTGSDGLKTAEQAARYGGTANTPYDPNYHERGDDISNVNMTAFATHIAIIANAVGTYTHDLGSLTRPLAAGDDIPPNGDNYTPRGDNYTPHDKHTPGIRPRAGSPADGHGDVVAR